ncbi:MAG: tetratricopeptide repeat-containing glycosyltransferase [Janthinobacterium lividum]
MNEAGQTIALCMIVKNEQHVLRRCLQSVLHRIDHWVVVDTGSTDGTQDLVRDVLGGIPGALIEQPWKNFGHNRSQAVSLARGCADYLLTLDADEYLQAEPGFQWPHLTHDAYDFVVDSGGTTYSRIQLVRSSLPWRYEGVLHEYITCDGVHRQARMPGIRTVRLLEGARSRNPETYRNDARILEEALQLEPTNARNTFYLAQSYRDAHEPALAMEWYRRRVAMGGFAEEVWFSLYEGARLLEATGADWEQVEHAYLEAYAARRIRAEPLYRVGMHYQLRKEYEVACVFLQPALQIPFPATDLLFVEADVYRFLLPLEYAVACYWLGLHEEAMAVTDRLLAETSLSAERREHLLRNRQYSVDALQIAAPHP